MMRQNRIYAKKKKKSFLVPTVFILSFSAVAALGGTLYWDSLQNKQLLEHQQLVEEGEAPKEIPSQPEQTAAPQENGQSSPMPVSKTTQQGDAASQTQPVSQPVEGEPVTSAAQVPQSQERAKNEYFSDAAFVGDSITQGMILYEIVPEATIIANKGINLDTVYDSDKIRTSEGYVSVLDRLQEVNPKKIYIMFGANGVGWFTPEHFTQSYGKFVDTVKEQHPDSIIYLQSITPVTATYAQADNNIDNQKINEYNKLILKVAEEKGVYYLDVASALKDENGALPEDACQDGMHFSVESYQKWLEYLKTHTVTEE